MLEALRIDALLPDGDHRELTFGPAVDEVRGEADGSVHFAIDEGWIYLTTKEDRNFSKPPQADALALQPGREYELRFQFETDVPKDVSLWLIEYGNGERLCHWHERPNEDGGVVRRWRTHRRLASCCLALRLTGRGRLRLASLEVREVAQIEVPPIPPEKVFDPRRDEFDLGLFLDLNEEYEEKPLVTQARSFARKAVLSRGENQARQLRSMFGLVSGRILEIGSGRGEVLRALVAHQEALEAVGVDIAVYPQWEEFTSPRLRFEEIDVTREDYTHLGLGSYDFIFSLAVWEHVVHPFAALKALEALLKPGGRAYLVANLYRGPKASHRYREVHFPWPHLLFQDKVFYEFYARVGKSHRAAWVNKLTSAHYLQYFDLLDLEVERIWYKETPIDEAFYRRFEDTLSRYPRFDLEKDFIHAVLRKPEP